MSRKLRGLDGAALSQRFITLQTRSAVKLLVMVLRTLQTNVDMNVEDHNGCADLNQRFYRGFRVKKRVWIMHGCQRRLASADLTLSTALEILSCSPASSSLVPQTSSR